MSGDVGPDVQQSAGKDGRQEDGKKPPNTDVKSVGLKNSYRKIHEEGKMNSTHLPKDTHTHRSS